MSTPFTPPRPPRSAGEGAVSLAPPCVASLLPSGGAPSGAPGARALPPGERPRFLSEADCHEIANRLARAAQGGGYTLVQIKSTWRGNIRWARNQVSTSGEDRNDHVVVHRDIRGATNPFLLTNRTTDAALVTVARRAERLARLNPEAFNDDVVPYETPEPPLAPPLFFASTYQLDAGRRAEAARALAQSSADAGMLSAGYIEVSAQSVACICSWGPALYCQYTSAQYSVTVRDPKGVGSGWAGVDWPDWSRIEGPTLSAIALDKCLKSRNPVAVEPGRYTTILEPQAACDLVSLLLGGRTTGGLLRYDFGMHNGNEGRGGPFNKSVGYSKLGERVMDERLTVRSDPMDPDLGFVPFSGDRFFQPEDFHMGWAEVYHPVTWIERGVLMNLAYARDYAVRLLAHPTGLPHSGAFRMEVTGPTASIEEMIEATPRGLLVTRLMVNYLVSDINLCRGTTRDGLWLIEHGKISKPVTNMQCVESPLVALNQVEQLGVPQRVFRPASNWWRDMPKPAIVPAMKIKDFTFTALVDAI